MAGRWERVMRDNCVKLMWPTIEGCHYRHYHVQLSCEPRVLLRLNRAGFCLRGLRYLVGSRGGQKTSTAATRKVISQGMDAPLWAGVGRASTHVSRHTMSVFSCSSTKAFILSTCKNTAGGDVKVGSYTAMMNTEKLQKIVHISFTLSKVAPAQ